MTYDEKKESLRYKCFDKKRKLQDKNIILFKKTNNYIYIYIWMI